MATLRQTAVERFFDKVKISGGCWTWMGAVNPAGYGLFNLSARSCLAHRVCWAFVSGPVPRGMCVLHRCDNPKCVRPSHLFLGTQADNIKDMVVKRRHVSHRRVGYMPTGERHHYFNVGPKLTREEAQEIRSANGSQSAIAKRFDIHQSMVSRIKSGTYWK